MLRPLESALRACFQPPLGILCRVLFGLRLEGMRHIPSEGPALLVANHQGYLDPLFLQMAVARPVRYMVTADFYDIRAIQPFFLLVNAIRVGRGVRNREALRAALKSLEQDRLVGIFPEGRLSITGDFNPIRPGVGYLASKSGAPIVPARIRGSIRVLPKGHWKLRQARVTVRFGEPFCHDDPGNGSATDRILEAWNEL